jgi:hypothetical protein
MLRNALVVLSLLLTACAVTRPTPDFYPTPGSPNVRVYLDRATQREVPVFDLAGQWEADYVRSGREVVRISQSEDTFEGVKTIGSPNVPAGSLTIKGSVHGNLVQCGVYHLRSGWSATTYAKINPDGNSFTCGSVNGNLTFRRLRQ